VTEVHITDQKNANMSTTFNRDVLIAAYFQDSK